MSEEEIREFLINLPVRYDILEEGVDLKTQEEYISYSESFEPGELTEDQTVNLGKILFDPRVTLEVLKKALTLLAHLGTITAFRQIEEFYKICGKEIRPWTALALQECKMFLESELTDQNTGFISSGLGGHNGRLRYYFIILPAAEKPFTLLQKNVIQGEFTLVSKEMNSVVESFDLSDNYVGLTTLIPYDVAVGTFIEKGINNCNELGDFILEQYFGTNQNIPDKDEIRDIIKILNNHSDPA